MKPQTVRVETTRQLRRVHEEWGALISIVAAANVADVSRERIYHLLDEGRFTRFVLWGVAYVALDEFEQWNGSERSVGRPRKSFTKRNYFEGGNSVTLPLGR